MEDPWARLASARVARLATISATTGAPHIVPITFVADRERGIVVHAIDHKPKATRALARLANLRADPRASILADAYDDEDWSQLWWVRADGTARILDADAAHDLVDELVDRYPQYVDHRPEGPVIVLEVERIRGWQAA
jgi:PPOX class probable F420-dependent enzyme